MTDNHLFRRLFDGPIDVIGDIHGELDALLALLGHLGYDARGEHRQDRRLVFIGDLCDRGHDSPGVVAFVRRLVERRHAQCLLGNHELNVLRGASKEGNGWFFAEDHDRANGKFAESRRAEPGERDAILAFFADLPVVLERPDLRLVHAAWDDAALALLRENTAPTLDVYRAYANRANDIVKESGLGERAAADWRAHGPKLTDPQARVPLLENLGRLDALRQMSNPLRIVTSGPEALTAQPFFAAGKWRMLDRVKWWDRYAHDKPVMVGHYWRWATPAAREAFSRGEHDLFGGAAPEAWHGARRNVFCLDYGVGARYKERALGRRSGFQTRLGAVRWPERELVFDDGETRRLREI
jgi:hypothetical protein